MSRTSGVPDGAPPAPDPVRIVARWAVECRTAMEAAARRLTGDPGVAEDMAQEATIKALEVARADPQRVLNVRRPCRWMCGIVLHVTLRWLEKETRRECLLGENAFLLRELLHPQEDANWNVEELVEEVLDMAPDLLTPRQLDVVTLRLAGMSTAEIAEALDMAEATVRVHQAAAVRRLRSAMRGSRGPGGGGVSLPPRSAGGVVRGGVSGPI